MIQIDTAGAGLPPWPRSIAGKDRPGPVAGGRGTRRRAGIPTGPHQDSRTHCHQIPGRMAVRESQVQRWWVERHTSPPGRMTNDEPKTSNRLSQCRRGSCILKGSMARERSRNTHSAPIPVWWRGWEWPPPRNLGRPWGWHHPPQLVQVARPPAKEQEEQPGIPHAFPH